MNLSTSILGSTAVKQLQATTTAWVLEVGSDRLTRGELAGVGCYNFVAAKNLTTQLKASGAKSLADLYARLPPTALALPHLGVISLAVLGAAFEAKGIGGDAPLEAWAKKHYVRQAGAVERLVTFHTLKARELAELAKERTAKKARTRARRDHAHDLRVTRFTARHHGAA